MCIRDRYPSNRRRSRTGHRAILYGGAAVYSFRYRSDLSVSVGAGLPRFASVRFCGDGAVHFNFAVRLHIPLEERRARLESDVYKRQVLSYPDIALTKPALYPATGKVGILGDLLIGRKSLLISGVASAGSSGGPVISAKGKAIGIVAHEAESQGAGATRIFVGAIPGHYLGELFPPNEDGLST